MRKGLNIGPSIKPGYNISGIGLDALFIVLLTDGFDPVFEDENTVVMTCRISKINVEISHRSELVTKVVCNSILKENFIPLTIAELNKFVMSIRTNRSEKIILN